MQNPILMEDAHWRNVLIRNKNQFPDFYFLVLVDFVHNFQVFRLIIIELKKKFFIGAQIYMKDAQ